MDEKENVVFNNQPGQSSVEKQSADPAVVTPQEAEQTAQIVTDQGGGEQSTDTVPPDGGVPPPVGILGNDRLKKIIIGVVLLLIIIVLIFLFIPKQQQAKNVKLVWWGLWEDDRAVQSLIADFEKENKNINIEYVKQDPKDYRNRLVARMEKDDGPDIFRYHNSWLPMVQGMLEPLSADVITPEEFEKVYYPVMKEDLVLDGAIYGIPLGADTLALFVNTELLQAEAVDPPTDWNEFAKVAAKNLTKKDSDNGKITQAGAALGTYENVSHASDIMSMIFVQQGVTMKKTKDAEGNLLSSGASFVNAPLKKKHGALEFYNDFYKGSGKHVKGSVWDTLQDNSVLAFSKGKLAMMFGYSWDIFEIQKTNKNLPFAVYQVPRVPGGKNKTIASYWVEGVSSKSVNKTESLKFMHYLAQKETAQKFYTEASKLREFGEPPARKDLADTVKDNKLVYPFVNQLNNASSSFFSSDTRDGDTGINTLTGIYLSNAGNKLLNEDSSSIDTLMETFNNGIIEAFGRYENK